MNKAHRDRIAFMRICSGRYEAGMEVKHVQGGKVMRLSQPQQIMASERKILEEAYAGDIIGVFDPGIFSIGDTLCMPKEQFPRAFCKGSADGYDEKKAVCKRNHSDRAGRCDSDFPGI